MSAGDLGPVMFAYDGSDLAKLAIEEAGRRLAQAAPRLSTATRLALLARARWSRLGHE